MTSCVPEGILKGPTQNLSLVLVMLSPLACRFAAARAFPPPPQKNGGRGVNLTNLANWALQSAWKESEVGEEGQTLTSTLCNQCRLVIVVGGSEAANGRTVSGCSSSTAI